MIARARRGWCAIVLGALAPFAVAAPASAPTGAPTAATDPKSSAPAAGTSWVALGAGVAQIFDPDLRGMVTFEYRYAAGPLRASPWLAAEATTTDRFFGFGASLDIPIGQRTILTPAFGGSMYLEHDGLGLGWHLEYRSSLEVTWPVGGARIGAAFAHFSNMGLGNHNPGTEILRVMWIVPIGRR